MQLVSDHFSVVSNFHNSLFGDNSRIFIIIHHAQYYNIIQRLGYRITLSDNAREIHCIDKFVRSYTALDQPEPSHHACIIIIVDVLGLPYFLREIPPPFEISPHGTGLCACSLYVHTSEIEAVYTRACRSLQMPPSNCRRMVQRLLATARFRGNTVYKEQTD